MLALKKAILHLSLIDGIGPVTIDLILRNTHNLAGIDIYAMPASFFQRLGISQAKSRALQQGLADFSLLNQELQLIKQHNVKLISIFDQEYPSFLKEITLPPVLMYCQGDVGLLSASSIGIVGARKADMYGKRVIQMLLPTLVESGLTIVSGGAAGIDTFAHMSALKTGGSTISVLGSGLLQLYPRSNISLFKEIIQKNSLLISCFRMNMQPLAHNFPERNRIIAGLSKGCVVIQAEAKSGALITARYALEQGREVFAVPGPIDSGLSQGCHALIAQGAIIVQSAQTILENIDHVATTLILNKNNIVTTKSLINCDDPILNACSSPCSFDKLITLWQGSEQELYDHLFNLECEQKIEQDISGLWVAILI